MSTIGGDTASAEVALKSHGPVLVEATVRWTLLALIAGVPVTVMPAFTYDVFNVPKIGVMIVGLSVAAALYLFARIMGSAPPIPRAAWVVPAATFLPLLVAWLLSPYRDWALFGQYARFQGLLPYGMFGVFSLLAVASFRGRERQLAWALAVAGASVGVGLLLGMAGVSPTGEVTQAGTLGNSNYVGGFLAIALPVAVCLWLSEPGRSYGAMAATALTVVGVILSYSQGGQIAAVAATGLVIGSHTGGVRLRRISLLIAAALAAAVTGVVALNFVHPIGGFGAMDRSNMWKTAIAMGNDSPVTGSGPNAFAIEGPRYRSLEDSLTLGTYVGGYVPIGIKYQTSDDPHSVPLSFYANAGLIGVIGLLAAWIWIIRRGLRVAPEERLGTAFFAATAGYLVQALVSIDEPTLRLGFWTAVSGLVAATETPRQHGSHTPPSGRRARVAIGTLLSIALAMVGGWYGVRFIRADHETKRGAALFDKHTADGAAALRAALELRDEALYREVLAGNLGIAALESGENGAALIEEMKEVNTYLSELPDVGAIHAYARIMSYWGHYDASGYATALDLYQRARRLDPVNPLIKVETAEVLVDLGRRRAALDLLKPLAAPLQGRVPEYWAALAITRLEAGHVEGAREALIEAVALQRHDCRVLLAQTLTRVQTDRSPTNDPAAVLTLRLNCDPGLYNMFLRRLPAEARPQWT